MKKSFFVTAIFAIGLLFTSCGSDIKSTVTRPAELNLNGAKSISVLPFQTSAFSDNGTINISGFFNVKFSTSNESARNCTDYITSQLTNSLLNSGFLNVVGSKRVESAIKNGDEIPCDVYLTGYLTNFDTHIAEHWDKTNERYEYERKVSFYVTYEVIDAKTNYVLSRMVYQISNSSGYYRYNSSVPSALSVVDGEIDKLVSKIMKQLEPYEETKYLSLLDDKEKSDDMKAAKKIAKEGYLETSYKQYYQIYSSTRKFEAGYNAAIILEALGDYDGAEALMNQLYSETGNKKAATALTDIRQERSLNNQLQNQLFMRNKAE